jgi:hypothetical protein
MRLRAWLRTAGGGAAIQRGLVTSLVVGTILTVVNHGEELMRSGLRDGHLVPIAFTYAVPFVVSVVSSVAAVRSHDHAP